MVSRSEKKMRNKKQVVVKLQGDYDLVKELLDLVESRTEGIVSRIMPSGTDGDYHAFATVFRVVECEEEEEEYC